MTAQTGPRPAPEESRKTKNVPEITSAPYNTKRSQKANCPDLTTVTSTLKYIFLLLKKVRISLSAITCSVVLGYK